MKRLISLFLVIAICLSFASCADNAKKDSKNSKLDKHTEAIVGQWKSTNFFMFTFNEDKTGSFLHQGAYNDFTWIYDENLSCYTIASSAIHTTVNFFLKNENGLDYLECSHAKLYRDEDFHDILSEHLEECRAELKETFQTDTTPKTEFNKPYTSGDLSITFTELVVEDNQLNLYVEITNNGKTSLESISPDLLDVGFRYRCYAPGHGAEGLGIGYTFSFVDDRTEIAPGETAVLRTTVVGGYIMDAITVFETVIGAATCYMSESPYYIDFGEYSIKNN